MIIGVPTETLSSERRVALTPAGVAALVKSGHQVLVQAGAGAEAGFPDRLYQESGARSVPRAEDLLREGELFLQVRALAANRDQGRQDLERIPAGRTLIGLCDSLDEPLVMEQAATHGLTVLAMELMPRTTRAQSMDALSSMANIAGYKAVLLAAGTLPRLFPMMMTAAGTITPARVFIVGAGVAGLQAIATARRLGASVQAYDVRPAVKLEVQSLGARFVELPLDQAEAQDAGGYAKALGEAFYRAQRELMARVVAESDVVITTALVPGKTAPLLVTEEMVKGMAPGSVVVDLAAERGGNCACTCADETVVVHGVTVIGPTNLPATVPYHASQMYSKNISGLVQHLTKEGKLVLDPQDEITRGTLVTHQGKLEHSRVQEALQARRQHPGAEGDR